MSNIRIENCSITKSSVEIKDSFIIKENNYHTGIDIPAKEVYSICQGIVLNQGKDDNGQFIVIQYNDNICIKYNRLKEIDVYAESLVDVGQLVGIADKFVHVEYLTRTKQDTDFIVRIGRFIYYKNDPLPILTGQITFKSSPYTNTQEGTSVLSTSEFYYTTEPDIDEL